MVQGDVDLIRIIAGTALMPTLLIEAREVGEVDALDRVVARILQKMDVMVVKCCHNGRDRVET